MGVVKLISASVKYLSLLKNLVKMKCYVKRKNNYSTFLAHKEKESTIKLEVCFIKHL